MLDISQYNFSDWLKFTFAHPLTTPEWYFSEDWEYQGNHSKMIEYSTKLFNAPELLVEDYFFEQINQGLWFIPSAYGYILYLLDEDIPWKIRKECIDSFYNLFLYLFSKYKISGGADIMWWDSIFSYGVYEDPVRGIKTFGFFARKFFVLCRKLFDAAGKSRFAGRRAVQIFEFHDRFCLS